MAKPNASYHMRQTFFVTLTHWTETSPEVEVRYHSQAGDGMMRLYGTLHVPFPIGELHTLAIGNPLRSMCVDRLAGPWRAADLRGGVYVPESGRTDLTLE